MLSKKEDLCIAFKLFRGLFITFCLMCFSAHARTPSTLEAGIAVTDVTPDMKQPFPLAGYMNRLGQPAKGVRDPVFCQALALRKNGQEIFIVSCDLVGISARLRQKVSQKLAAYSIPSENLMLAATHNHSGPGGYHALPLFSPGFGTYNEELTEQMANQIAETVLKARAKRQPCQVRLNYRPAVDIAWNRRDPQASFSHDLRRFQSWSNRAKDKFKPPVLTSVWFETTSGQPFAVLFHMAMHNTVLGADNHLISADWAGVARRTIASQMPGLQAIYLNGAEGDLTPIMIADQRSDDDYLEQVGHAVAQQVLDQYAKSQTIAFKPFQVHWLNHKMPIPSFGGIPVSEEWSQGYFDTMPLQILDFGTLTLMALPVELTAQAGERLHQLAIERGKKYPLVIGLANDYMLYCTLPEEQPAGGYEVLMTIFGQEEFKLILDGFQLLLK